jgi:hypothetical protein
MLRSVREELMHSRAFETEMRKFAEIVSKNAALQKQLQASVDGGIDRKGFRDLYIRLAVEHGIHFTADQMEIAMQEQKQGKDKILPLMVQKLVSVL